MSAIYSCSNQDRQQMRELGVEEHELNGFGVMDAETFILREYYSNRRESGFPVPEEYQPNSASDRERQLKSEDGKMYFLEYERTVEEFTSGPSEYKWYEDEDLEYDDTDHKWIPIWMLEKLEKRRNLESLQIELGLRKEDNLCEVYERKLRNIILRENYLRKKEIAKKKAKLV